MSEFGVVALFWTATAVALVFLAVRALAGWLVTQGGMGETVGKALLNIYP